MLPPVQPLPDLLKQHARIRPEQPAFSDSRRTITFAALATSTRLLAAHLIHHVGTSPVAIVLPRCIEYVEAVLAVNRASRIGVPLDPRASVAELRWALEDCGPRVIITDQKGLERVLVSVSNIAGILILLVNATQDDVVTEGQAVRMVRYEEWSQKELSHENDEHASNLDHLGLDEPAWLHYTSGTTGQPKGVLSSQRAWLVSAANYAEAVGITALDKLFWPLPLYHAFAHSLCVVGTLIVGSSVYLTGQGDGVLSSIQKCEGITVVAGVPSTYHELATELAHAKGVGNVNEIRLPQPRLCVSAGGTPSTELKTEVEEMFGVPLLNNYGSTEACGPIATSTPGHFDDHVGRDPDIPLLNRYGSQEPQENSAATTSALSATHGEDSCGAPLPHVEVQIFKVHSNNDMCDLAADGEEGEIWVRGPSLMLHYWGSQPPRQAPLTDAGWYRTGDLGRRLPGSGRHLSVTGRLNELIRRGSETINPAEVERVLRSCPGVEDAVVTGIPHNMLGETAVAFIVRAASETAIDVVALLAACRALLPDYKVPVTFFEIEALPRTKTGKLSRRAALSSQAQPLNAKLDLKQDTIVALVLAEVRGVCGLGVEERLDSNLPFVDLGMNSLAGVVLRDRLASLTGLSKLPTTLVFDHPTPMAVSEYLSRQLFERSPSQRRNGTTPAEATASTTNDDKQSHEHDPIAIISMACRYPGSVASPDDLWDVVASSTDVTSCFPTDRGWDLEALSNSDPDNPKPGTSKTDRGGFLNEMAHFDPAPFYISPREALATDPQQRLLLEETWHLAERARIAPSTLRGSDTGVFVGVMYNDYAGRFLNSGPHELESHLALGSAGSVAAGRISYTFDLHGPSMAIDSACSSSLVAIDLAVKSLRSGECALAIAGGVTIMASPQPFIMFSEQGGLAPDGRCKSYSAAADGTAWSEGVGLLMLERLSDARRNGHKVLGLVRGTAVNSDGASNGLTAPNGAAQERVIRQALENARLDPGEIDVLEGHGTATRLGDAIETQAVVAVYGRAEREMPMLLGSIKSNIGHSQAAAGVAGVMKMVQAMKHGVVPKSLHVDKPSLHIANESQVELATEARSWRRRTKGGPRRAAVSSFGIGGTNSHIILEEYEADRTEAAPTSHLQLHGSIAQGSYPLLLSGADAAGLRAQAEALLGYTLKQQDEATGTTDIAFSLATTRSALPHRAAVLLREGGIKQHASALTAIAQNHQDTNVVAGVVPGQTSRLVFMFSGQASLKEHSIRGIKDLCNRFSAFDMAFRTICDELDPLLECSLSETIRDDLEQLFKQTDHSQAVIFALEVAMFRLLESFGVHPDAVVGHSVGEVAAAHVAGYLSLPGAVALIAARGKLMAALPSGQGAMASISASKEDVRKALDGLTAREGACDIAAVNAENSVVVSGAIKAVNVIVDVFASQGRRVTVLKGVDHAFHSSFMDPILEELRQALRNDLAFCNPAAESTKIPLISTVTGKVADASQLASPEYWASQVRAAVRFADAIVEVDSRGPSCFLEIGPSAPLSLHVHSAIATRGEVNTLLESLARLWVCGIQVDWNAVFQRTGAQAVDLPVYQFQRRRYWLDPPQQSMKVQVSPDSHEFGVNLNHPILTSVMPVPGTPGNVVCHGKISLATLPWLADHTVDGQSVVPATVLADLALSAGRECSVTMPILEELVMIKPLVLTSGAVIVIQVLIQGPETGHGSDETSIRSIDVYSRPQKADVNQDWTRHATGALKQSPSPASPGIRIPVQKWQAVDMDIGDAYSGLANAGVAYGPAFQCVHAVWRTEDGLCLRAKLRLASGASRPKSLRFLGIHPALLDAALHVGVLVTSAGKSSVGMKLQLPFLLRGVQMLGNVSDDDAMFVEIQSRTGLSDDDSFSLTLRGQADDLVAIVTEVVTRPWKHTPQAADLFKVKWTPLSTRSSSIESKDIWQGSQASEDKIVQVRDLVTQEHPSVSFPDAVHSATAQVLDAIQQWMLDEDFDAGGRLVVVTERASTSDPDLTSAAVWGLVRSAQTEVGPERLVLIDLDGTTDSAIALPQALTSGQGLVAVRAGRMMIPRLSRIQPMPLSTRLDTSTSPVNVSGTVLITGGTGALGAALARHLVRVHNAKNLILVSRIGPALPGAEGLLADLTSAGATTRILACDVTDRSRLSAIFSMANTPITAIIHTAGVLDDGILSSQTPRRISSVLRPKVDGSWLLHELSSPQTQLFLFSSAAGVLGNGGQAGYAAGNCFLDGLAEYRRARGLHGLSLAWGPWENEGGMAGGMVQGGMLLAVADKQGFDAFDAAVQMDGDEAVVVPLLLRGGPVESYPLLSQQQTPSLAKSPGTMGRHLLWREHLAAIQSQADRTAALRGLVHDEVAQVLGYQQGETLPDRPFADLGMDSFTAIQLRNRIGVLSGLKGLPATLAFDANTLTALVDNLLARFGEFSGDDGPESMPPSHTSIHSVGALDQPDTKANHEVGKPAATHTLAQENLLGGLASLCQRMCQAGQYNAAAQILAATSLILPRFTTSSPFPVRPAPCRLATGSAAKPVLLVVPDFTPTAGGVESRYTHLALAMGSEYDIYELPHPTVLVPDSLDTLAEMHAATIREVFADRAVILVGFSAGGCVAHAVTLRLMEHASDSNCVVGLILMDTYAVSQDKSPEWLMRLALPATAMLARFESNPEEEKKLAEIGAYFRIIAGWHAEPLPRKVRTLFVRSKEAMPGLSAGWYPAEWLLADQTMEVPGHHLAMLDDPYVQTVAEVVHNWIDETRSV